jgi:hypothetical protein
MMLAEAVQVTFGLGCAVLAGAQANAHDKATPWASRFGVAILGAAGVLAAIGVPLSRAPVVTEARAEVVSIQPGELRMRVWGTKPTNRAECEFLRADGYVMRGGIMTESALSWESDPAPNNTRPAGRHYFGIARFVYPAEVYPDLALIVSHHSCAWWMPDTHTRLGPWGIR